MTWISPEIRQTFVWCWILIFAATTTAQEDCTFTGKQAFTQPTSVKSPENHWRVTLQAVRGNVTVDWLSLERRTFNGSAPAPTIRLKQGDHFEILLENKLDLEEKVGRLNEHRFPNSVNLHLHGMHIDSKVPGDNVLIRVKPGHSYLYSYNIEDDQSAGTYWYHPHVHGSTIIQVNSGMAGMLIVEDGEENISDQLKSATCPFNCEHDVQLMFQPTLLYQDKHDPFVKIQRMYSDTVRGTSSSKGDCPQLEPGQSMEDWLQDSSGLNHFTTNGQLNPVLTMSTGQMKRFRMVNAGGSAVLELELVNSATYEHDCEYMEIALDGVYLDRPRVPRRMKTLLVPGGRADWLVRCNIPGTHEIRSRALDVDTDSLGAKVRRINTTLLTIIVEGEVRNGSMGEVPLPRRPHYVNFETRRDLETSFSIEIGPQVTLNREHYAGEHYFRHLVKVNEHVQWNFLNTDPRDGHPIHIHVNHFKIVGYEPYLGPVADVVKTDDRWKPWLLYSQDTTLDNRVCKYQHEAFDDKYSSWAPSNATLLKFNHHEVWDKDVAGTVGYSQRGDYRDTLMVPPLSNITIQFIVHKFTDIVVVHCHFLNHEDQGMMLLVDIINPDEGEKTGVNPKSGNALPGQCNNSTHVRINRALSYLWVLIFLFLLGD